MTRRICPRSEIREDGAVLLRDMKPLLCYSLRAMPELLHPDAPGIRDRLSGTPYPGDEEGTRHWEKYAAPELAHLFLEASAIVEGDLVGLRRDGKGRRHYRLDIPPSHVNAWLSSLSAARVGLAEIHGFGEVDLESELPRVIVTNRDRALLIVHLLGWVQGLLLEAGA